MLVLVHSFIITISVPHPYNSTTLLPKISNTVKCHYLALSPLTVITHACQSQQQKGQKAHNVVYIYPSSSPLNTLQPISTSDKPHKLFRIKMFQNFETNTQGKLKTINQSTASPESLLFPSKHVRSDSHLISISCEALA